MDDECNVAYSGVNLICRIVMMAILDDQYSWLTAEGEVTLSRSLLSCN